MTQLTDQERISLINDMRSFDEQMPCVGLFWYDRAGHSFFGVRKQEITPQMVEEAAEKGSPFISYPEMQMELSVRMFTGADEPWLYFVTDCRKSRGHNYDLVQPVREWRAECRGRHPATQNLQNLRPIVVSYGTRYCGVVVC